MTDAEARRQIRNALLSYCRGIDRLDPEALAAAFHPGAELVDYGPESMTIEAFTERALASLGKRFTATQHRISNTAIDLEGEKALVETYVLAYHVEAGDDGDRLHTFNGRYIDRFELRAGSWRIARRTLRYDWSTVESMGERMGGPWVASGRAGSPDPLYAR